jgi:transcriptional regulator with XRE-family HTH domain/tetratricopeptide (TPR) repeat protein
LEFVSFGYWVRRRRMALDLTQATLAHLVGCATVTIKKIEHEERRPSQRMAERLAESLGIPEDERAFFIKIALGESPVADIPLPTQPEAPFLPERWVTGTQKTALSPWDLFVGREPELAWLEGKLQSMLSGKGQVAFIVGGAGRGKTALLLEFVRRAVEAQPDLIASGGICTAYAGIGDPFLPFREALGFLTGEVETHWLAKIKSRGHKQRIWRALPQTLQALAEHAPYLIEVLVSGKDLLRRAASVAPGGAAWLSHLQAEVTQRRKAASLPGQTTIYGQFNNLVSHLSLRQPLLIVLDDLHWADDASLGLLFHLARHLGDKRILILGTYRPEELVSEHSAEPHLLENVLGELKRTFGQIILDLDAADQVGGRYFIDAYLNSLPNQFSPSFHQALYQHTAGHPLFTVEFVGEMQAHGDLVLGDSGQWREAENLDWSILPPRVEAVIAQRLMRLEAKLTQILKVASVEGEQFNAEVVARVLGVSESEVVERLSLHLAKRHYLVQAHSETRISNRVLTPYTFRHALFQQYLYDQLDPGERRRLHEAVAGALEMLYQDEVETIAAQLAWHYQEARQVQKAVDFLEMAGKRAIRLSGYEEAVYLLERGLSLLAALQPSCQQIDLKLEMLLALGEAFYRSGQLDLSLDTYQRAAALARAHNATRALARAALGYEESRWRFNFPLEPSRRLLEEAFELLGDEDPSLKTRLAVGRVRTLALEKSQAQFASLSRQVIEMARSLGDPMILYDALYLIPWGSRHPQDSPERLNSILEMRRLAELTGDIARQQEALNNHTLELLELGDLQNVIKGFSAQQKLIEKAHFLLYHYLDQLGRATLAIMMGDFTEGESLAHIALQISRQMTQENADGIFGIQMFTIRREQGRLKEILPLVKLFVEQHHLSGTWRPGLALIYSDLDLREDARQIFETLANQDFAGIPHDALWLTCIAYLAEVCAYLGDTDRAEHLYRFMLPYSGRALVAGYWGACYGAVDRYLGLLAAAQLHWEQAERHFQDALAMNERMEAWPWLAHTQGAYARMLLQRGRTEDRGRAIALLDTALETARSLEMMFFIEKVKMIQGEF